MSDVITAHLSMLTMMSGNPLERHVLPYSCFLCAIYIPDGASCLYRGGTKLPLALWAFTNLSLP